jgi:hypothetical protein
MPSWLSTSLDAAGLALIAAGCWWIFPPAGLIVAGVLVLLVSYLRGGL